MQVIRQRYYRENEVELAWRPIDPYCAEGNTGQKAYLNLERYNVATGVATGEVKPNSSSSPDYVPPVTDTEACPIEEESNIDWRPINPFCTKDENKQNTGEKYWLTLKAYDKNTGEDLMQFKNNQPSDPDYVPPVRDIFFCPVPAPPPSTPKENCRVHFSGILMSDQVLPPPQQASPPESPGENDVTYTKIYVEDAYSEFVGAGDYPDNEVAFPKSVANSFDGIAVDHGTTLKIWSGKNFTGNLLLWVTGPALIYNVKWATGSDFYRDHYQNDKKRTFSEPLQSNYPQNKRIWSSSDMHNWGLGSCKIICSVS